ncbi:MAG: acyl-CoA dehydrogenase family protein [Gemmatimonadetes bacterium]|nr:acyl-CoA dehydrogenase family protein [Gemmatimonadota bacterium]
MTTPKPSFTRGLFAGAILDAAIFPYPPSLAQRDAGEARVVSRLIRELRALHGDLIHPDRHDAEETIPESVITAFGEMGMLGLNIPKQYGGLGLSATAYARVFATLASIDASLGVLVGVHCGLGSKAIVLFGNDAQKARYLPDLARGTMLAAYALTEPETGSDAANIVSRAAQNADGSWTLNGRKIWIGNGHRAGVIATFAQTDVVRDGVTKRRPTAFIIRPDMPGFQVAGTFKKLGIKGSTQADLVYDNLQVPADHVLGEVGKGFAVAVNVLNGGRLTLAAGCTGGAKELLGEMARYAESRVQFGQPLASFEITQRKMAHLAAETYASEAMLGILAHGIDADTHDWALEAAICKVFASELIWRASDEMVQVAGGRGYCQPQPYERWLRDARIQRIFEGANEVLRLFIGLTGIQGPAERLAQIGSAMRAPVKNFGIVSGFAADRVREVLGVSDLVDTPLHPRLQEHKKYLEKHVGEFKRATDDMIIKYRKQIIERQLVVERLAEMAIQLFATSAVLSRTQALITERGVEQCERELALTDLFCVQAGRWFRHARNALDAREEDVDARRKDIAAIVRAERGYWVTDPILDEPRGTIDERREIARAAQVTDAAMRR